MHNTQFTWVAVSELHSSFKYGFHSNKNDQITWICMLAKQNGKTKGTNRTNSQILMKNNSTYGEKNEEKETETNELSFIM